MSKVKKVYLAVETINLYFGTRQCYIVGEDAAPPAKPRLRDNTNLAYRFCSDESVIYTAVYLCKSREQALQVTREWRKQYKNNGKVSEEEIRKYKRWR